MQTILGRWLWGAMSAAAFGTVPVVMGPMAIEQMAMGQEPQAIVVKLTDGEVARGMVDARTDAERLWLRTSAGTAYVQRGIVWSRVKGASADGKELSKVSLQKQAAKMASEAPKQEENAAEVSDAADRVLPAQKEEVEDKQASARPGKLVSVTCSAQLANWDADVEPDGFQLEVIGLNENGERVPVKGFIEATLWSPVKRAFHERPATAGVALERVENWRVTANERESQGGASVVRLPFGSVHPDFQKAIGTHGALQVKCVVPGTGVFYSTIDPMQIRTYAPIEDAFRQGSGGRHLPEPGTGRSVGVF